MRKFVLVFFDEILVYSKTWEENLNHLDHILKIFQEQNFYAKQSKCEFSMMKILYLGHITSHEGFRMDEHKITSIQQWSAPISLMQLRGFLGLCNYYRRFIHSFSHLATPLTQLTMKNAFVCINKSQEAFEKLKKVICTCPCLAISDFSIPFIVEYDASKIDVEAVFMQKGQSITFESKKLSNVELNFNMQDKEILAIMHALERFKKYLFCGTFII